jgi:hypothetical protein
VPLVAVLGALGAIVIAVVVAAVFVLKGQSRGPASLIVTTLPAGAQVSVDGTNRGSSPVSLKGLKAGRHTITASLPSYLTRTSATDLKAGGHGTVNLDLPSLPLAKLVKVDRALLTLSYTRDPASGRWVVGAPLTSTSVRAISGRPISAVAEFRVSSTLPAARTLQLRPSYALFGPGGTPLGSFPPTAPLLKMDRRHAVAVFGSGFRLSPKGVATLPAGTYKVQLLVNGEVMKTLTLALG